MSNGETIGGGRLDKDIIKDIERFLLLEEEISSDNVVVTCQDGKVTLAGSVDSLEDKQKVEDIAEDTPGVVIVNNDLKVTRI